VAEIDCSEKRIKGGMEFVWHPFLQKIGARR
jgi:hypothetical protein